MSHAFRGATEHLFALLCLRLFPDEINHADRAHPSILKCQAAVRSPTAAHAKSERSTAQQLGL